MNNMITETNKKDQIQSEALKALTNNNGGLVVLDMGSGKSKVAIDFLKSHSDIKTVLITSPRDNLKKNWKEELEKWKIYQWDQNEYDIQAGRRIAIDIENIQTCYKWEKQYYDLVILDEVHTIATPEYGKLLENNNFKYLVALTGTPEFDKSEKKDFYDKYYPLVYEYYDSADDNLINKTRVLVYKYTLNNDYKVKAGNKKKRFYQGEHDFYNYLSEKILKGQKLMAQTGSEDWWNDAKEWFWENNAETPEQKRAAMTYLQGIMQRKNFLLKLKSSQVYARAIADEILKNKDNKVLIFSELTEQINKITQFSYHSRNKDDDNKLNMKRFNAGVIRELGSSKSLTLGLNLKGANYAIFESYTGSKTGASQKKGRLHRLDVDDIATLIILKPTGTQYDKWFDKIIKGLNTDNISYYNDLEELIKDI